MRPWLFHADKVYWEPWTPRVGQRVRVRLGGECPYCEETRADEDGRTGVVIAVSHRPGDPDDDGVSAFSAHHYWIAWDDRRLDLISHFAATELEPWSP